jgi:Flp pilus assembly protein TadD
LSSARIFAIILRAFSIYLLLLLSLSVTGSDLACFAAQNGPSAHQGTIHAMKGYEFFQQGQYQESVSEYQQALSVSPDDVDFHMGMVAALSRLGRWNEVVEEYKKILTLEPNRQKDVMPYYPDALTRLGRVGEAEAVHRQALTVDQGNAYHHAGLADALASQARHSEAIDEYQKAIQLSPSEAGYFYKLAQTMWSAGLKSQSVEAYRRASQLKPDDLLYQEALGYAQFNTKDYDGAVDAYQRASQLSVNDATVQQALKISLDRQEYERKLASKHHSHATATAARPAPSDQTGQFTAATPNQMPAFSQPLPEPASAPAPAQTAATEGAIPH